MSLSLHSTSPDGRFLLETGSWEVRMSLWIDCPVLREAANGAVVFRFRDAHWSLDAADWRDDGRVVLRLRKYPGGNHPDQLDVLLDPAAGRAWLPDGRELGFGHVEKELDRLIRR